MSVTTSLELPDALKASIGEVANQMSLGTNAVFGAAEVKAYVMARVAGEKPSRPKATPLDAAKPMIPAHG